MLASIISLVVCLAEPPKPIDPAAFDRLVVDSLRDVHNRGGALYNDARDFSGCYRMYEGALRTVRPLLVHRPAVQTRIDDGFAKLAAEKDDRAKAFRLHELIEAVRGDLRDAAAKPATAPAPVPLANVPTGPGTSPAVTGAVRLAGKSVAGAEITFVSLGLAEPVVRTVVADADGRYRFVPPKSGTYVVTITGPGVPERYATTTTSGLRIETKAEGTIKDWDLTPAKP